MPLIRLPQVGLAVGHPIAAVRFLFIFSQKTAKRAEFGGADLLTDSAICDIIYWYNYVQVFSDACI